MKLEEKEKRSCRNKLKLTRVVKSGSQSTDYLIRYRVEDRVPSCRPKIENRVADRVPITYVKTKRPITEYIREDRIPNIKPEHRYRSAD